MRTYVTSLNGHATRAHIGNLHWTACGYVILGPLCVSDAIPPGRTLCPKCAGAHADPGDPDAPWLLRERKALALLRQGRRDAEIARALGVSLRTAVRTIGAAQRRTGARTRFQFGYYVGRAERR